MHIRSPSPSLLLAAALLFATAPLPGHAAAPACPAVWKTIAADLKASFKGCTPDARMALRAAYNDCFPGTCDGSLILADECWTRDADNGPIEGLCDTLGQKATDYDVGTADMIQAAAAIAITACGGPKTQLLVGRPDSDVADKKNQLLPATATAKQQLDASKARGLGPEDTVALAGLRSAQTDDQGRGYDSTPTKLDSETFYPETAARNNPATLQSDWALSNATETAAMWKYMGARKGVNWKNYFVPAMIKLSTLGNNVALLSNCSSLL